MSEDQTPKQFLSMSLLLESYLSKEKDQFLQDHPEALVVIDNPGQTLENATFQTMMATAPQQAPVGAHRGPARRSRQESRRTPQTQPHPPGLRPLAQGGQEVGVSTFSEHNVRVEALE